MFGCRETLLLRVIVHTLANGAVIYSVAYDRTVNFGASKSHVAPLKTVTIPRSELLKAMLGLKTTMAVFFKDFNMDMNCFGLKNDSRIFKTFVANRICEIQTETYPKQWHFVLAKKKQKTTTTNRQKTHKNTNQL